MARESKLDKYFPDNSEVIFTNNAEEANTRLLYRLIVASENMAITINGFSNSLYSINARTEKLELSNEYYKKRNKEQNAIIKDLQSKLDK